ncbi:cyclase family protein [Amycolatopsis pithecellobii]|uniref:Cyclase family protein n=1 Tax=Amycolatopsis pithecellobii TaxID=664692 RepID=A0A6N7YHV4_9PSEU|nr:cyclase family protein [Amycolatopsis pithecellobii]MTD52477.1 cyclase family protein [Amycolatopsis pithecellobii]
MTTPSYRELPLIDAAGDYRHAWDVFPPDDNLGCLRRLTPEARGRGLATVTENTVVTISLPVNEPAPPLFGRKEIEHRMFAPTRNTVDDRLDSFFPQASTQWDGFRHVRAREFGFFTGYTGDFAANDRLGINHWAATGIIGRGILLDVAAQFHAPHDPDEWIIDAEALALAAEHAGVQVARGDVLCVRTGWMKRYQDSDLETRARLANERSWPGLAGSSAVAELLWDWGVCAVTADNPAVEASPGRTRDGSLHRRLLPLLGMPMGELFTFDRLAETCAELGRWEFLFVSVPLNLPGGVGSPGNAVAIL